MRKLQMVDETRGQRTRKMRTRRILSDWRVVLCKRREEKKMSKYGDNCKACEKCEKNNEGNCTVFKTCKTFRRWFSGAWNEIKYITEKIKDDKSKS